MKWIVGTIFGMVLLLSLVFQSSMSQTEEKADQTISENMALITDNGESSVGSEPSQLCGDGPKVYPQGVIAKTTATFNGPAGNGPGDFDYSWTIVTHKDKYTLSTKTAKTRSISVTPTKGDQRIDVFLIVSSKEDKSCQLSLCDFFWVIPDPIKDDAFCENKREDKTYAYAGSTKGMCVRYTVKDSKGNKIESGEESPFTAHFKNADKYPAGKYTVCMEVRPWTKGNGCGKDTIFSSCGVVNIILTPKGDITEQQSDMTAQRSCYDSQLFITVLYINQDN